MQMSSALSLLASGLLIYIPKSCIYCLIHGFSENLLRSLGRTAGRPSGSIMMLPRYCNALLQEWCGSVIKRLSHGKPLCLNVQSWWSKSVQDGVFSSMLCSGTGARFAHRMFTSVELKCLQLSHYILPKRGENNSKHKCALITTPSLFTVFDHISFAVKEAWNLII